MNRRRRVLIAPLAPPATTERRAARSSGDPVPPQLVVEVRGHQRALDRVSFDIVIVVGASVLRASVCGSIARSLASIRCPSNQDRAALEHARELAHVTRPGRARQCLARRCCHRTLSCSRKVCPLADPLPQTGEGSGASRREETEISGPLPCPRGRLGRGQALRVLSLVVVVVGRRSRTDSLAPVSPPTPPTRPVRTAAPPPRSPASGARHPRRTARRGWRPRRGARSSARAGSGSRAGARSRASAAPTRVSPRTAIAGACSCGLPRSSVASNAFAFEIAAVERAQRLAVVVLAPPALHRRRPGSRRCLSAWQSAHSSGRSRSTRAASVGEPMR